MLFASQGDDTNAAEWFEGTLKLNPQLREVHVQYAPLWRRQGNLQGAAEHLRTAIQIRPDQIAPRRNLSLIVRNIWLMSEALEL